MTPKDASAFVRSIPGMRRLGRLVRRFDERRNSRRLWTAVGKGLLPPPAHEFGAFGSGSMLLPPARVQSPEHIYIGSRVMIHEHDWFVVVAVPGMPPPKLLIGDGTTMMRYIKIVCTGEVAIGDEVGVSDGVIIADTHYVHDDPSTPIVDQGLQSPRPVRIGRGSFLGFRAIIEPGVTIGDNAYIGAGAVVMDDVPARSVVVGNPARVIRRYDEGTGKWVSVP